MGEPKIVRQPLKERVPTVDQPTSKIESGLERRRHSPMKMVFPWNEDPLTKGPTTSNPAHRPKVKKDWPGTPGDPDYDAG